MSPWSLAVVGRCEFTPDDLGAVKAGMSVLRRFPVKQKQSVRFTIVRVSTFECFPIVSGFEFFVCKNNCFVSMYIGTFEYFVCKNAVINVSAFEYFVTIIMID